MKPVWPRFPNRRLIATIRQSRLPDVINRLFAQHFGLHENEAALKEHDLVFDRTPERERRRARRKRWSCISGRRWSARAPG